MLREIDDARAEEAARLAAHGGTLSEPAGAPSETAAWIVHCDGSAVPNPGRMGLGAVLVAPDGTRHALSRATHTTGCNNEAELRALMAAIEESQALGATTLVIHSDNSILVEQLGGADPKPIARLAPLFDEARRRIALLAGVRLVWVPAHRNGEADAMARAALGLPARIAKPAKRRRR